MQPAPVFDNHPELTDHTSTTSIISAPIDWESYTSADGEDHGEQDSRPDSGSWPDHSKDSPPSAQSSRLGFHSPIQEQMFTNPDTTSSSFPGLDFGRHPAIPEQSSQLSLGAEPCGPPSAGLEFPLQLRQTDHRQDKRSADPDLPKEIKPIYDLWSEQELRKSQHQRHNGLIRQVDRLLDGFHELQRRSRNEGIVLRSLMNEEDGLKKRIRKGTSADDFDGLSSSMSLCIELW